MRSGWPHAQDGQGMPPADQRRLPLGPGSSWPGGSSDVEYRGGDHRYPAQQAAQPSDASQGQHPYAAFSASGYGDDGYQDPGYQGPAAQDAGIAGTRTVRGFVEPRPAQGGYPQPGYPQPGYGQGRDYSQGQDYPQGQARREPGYAGSSYLSAGEIEMAPPPVAPSTEEYHGADSYRQPWDYGQPLRYDDEVAYPDAQDGYQAHDGYQAAGDYGNGDYRGGGYDGITDGPGQGSAGYQAPSHGAPAYNGSEYSRPGIDGAAYDLSGIIGTNDFEAIGYDEPSYDRLSYDDPRYEDGPRHGGPPSGPQGRPRFDETRFDMPALGENRLDNLWLPGDDARRDMAPSGYGNDGFSPDGPVRSGYSDLDLGDQSYRFDETRLDMSAGAVLGLDHTRFDVPAFDETRLDRRSAVLLAPPVDQPRSWAEDTSFDHFADLDLTDEPVPAAFTRTLDRPQADDDTAARRAIGRRRGRSGDRRQWMALGAIAVVAAGAIGGVLMKYVFAGPSGPAHEVVASSTVDGYTRSADLEKQMKVSSLADTVSKSSSGSASDVKSAVYKQGALTPGAGAAAQMFMFVGGKLAGADPSVSIANFEATYPRAQVVPAGALGGQAACVESTLNNESVSMCVWFDNDTFGALVSPTMTTAKLATTMDSVRPSLEIYAK
jgi:hypothetical protein